MYESQEGMCLCVRWRIGVPFSAHHGFPSCLCRGLGAFSSPARRKEEGRKNRLRVSGDAIRCLCGDHASGVEQSLGPCGRRLASPHF